MIDFHTHILPGIDDGSRDPEETYRMLQEENRQGVDRIVATPHFYANRISVEGFLRRREQSIQQMNANLTARITGEETFVMQPMQFGAEVYFFPGMGRAEKLRNLCVTKASDTLPVPGQPLELTDLILVEMPFDQWTDQVLQELRDILMKQQLRIVLAHVERYPEFQRDMRIWDQVMALPLTIQLNAGSFLKGRSRRKFCLRMLQDHQNVILGSDCHNMSSRRPNMQDAAKVIARKLGSQRVDLLQQRISQLLQE